MGATVFPILAHFLPHMLLFEGTFQEKQWRKVKQMQPMQVCIISGKRFEGTFENPNYVGPTVFPILAHVMWLERNMHCLHYLRLLRSYFAHVLVVPSLGQQCCIL